MAKKKKTAKDKMMKFEIEHKRKFKLLAELFCNPGISLSKLVKKLDSTPIAVKRILRQFRDLGIIDGKIGSTIIMNLAYCNALNFPSAIVFIGVDRALLKQYRRRKTKCKYKTEEELLDWIMSLAREESHLDRVIAEYGHLLMAEKGFRMMIAVQALSIMELRDFTEEIKRADCIESVTVCNVVHRI